MERTIQAVAIAAGVLILAGSTMGCSAIGYFVGGAIDGGATRVVDSLSVKTEADSAGREHRSLDMARVTVLAKETGPGKGAVVEVRTQEGSFIQETFRVDTVLAVRGDSTDSKNEELLPGDHVTMTIGDSSLTQVKGGVLGLSRKTIRLRVDGDDRGYPLNKVKEIILRDERVLSGIDLAWPGSTGRFVRVPGLLLGQESPPHFIPLQEVQQVSVTRTVTRWGTARIVCVAVGGALDILSLVASIEAASALSSLGQIGKF
jgi:hypothetical protein